MNEIFVEEENTIYELDAECLRMKEQQEKQEMQKTMKDGYKAQEFYGSSSLLWAVCILCILK